MTSPSAPILERSGVGCPLRLDLLGEPDNAGTGTRKLYTLSLPLLQGRPTYPPLSYGSLPSPAWGTLPKLLTLQDLGSPAGRRERDSSSWAPRLRCGGRGLALLCTTAVLVAGACFVRGGSYGYALRGLIALKRRQKRVKVHLQAARKRLGSGGRRRQGRSQRSQLKWSTQDQAIGPCITCIRRADCEYVKYFCEENIYNLLLKYRQLGFLSKDTYAVVISNDDRKVSVMYHHTDEQEIKWDYHVICIQRDRSGTFKVYDLDSILEWPVSFTKYMEKSFPRESGQRQPDARDPREPMFRVVQATKYLENFASDRHHMKEEESQSGLKFPDYSPIKAADGRTSTFVDKFMPVTSELRSRPLLKRGTIGRRRLWKEVADRDYGDIQTLQELHEMFGA